MWITENSYTGDRSPTDHMDHLSNGQNDPVCDTLSMSNYGSRKPSN